MTVKIATAGVWSSRRVVLFTEDDIFIAFAGYNHCFVHKRKKHVCKKSVRFE